MSPLGLRLRSALPGQPVWLQVGQLFEGEDAPPRAHAHVVYDAKRIRYVGTQDQAPPPEHLRPGQESPDLQLPDHTLLPGLTEAHAHLFLEGGELDPAQRALHLQRSGDELVAEASRRLPRLLCFGITAIRDAGDRHGVGLALSRRYRHRPLTEGSEPAPGLPYYESPGAAIHHQGRYGSFMGDPLEAYPSAEDCVAARVAAGADRIKLIPTGIINFKQGRVTAAPQMTLEEVRALVEAAHRHERQTFAHASGDDGIERALEGGVDSIEHGFFVRDDQLARMRDRQTAWVPTFGPIQAQLRHAENMGWDDRVCSHLRRILEEHGRALVKAHGLGVPIVAGSDAGSYGVPHGLGFWEELELMEQSGLPARAVLAAATGNGARRLAFREPVGRIAAGCRSRFILTHHSPLETVTNLRKPLTVVLDGNVYENEAGVSGSGL